MDIYQLTFSMTLNFFKPENSLTLHDMRILVLHEPQLVEFNISVYHNFRIFTRIKRSTRNRAAGKVQTYTLHFHYK